MHNIIDIKIEGLVSSGKIVVTDIIKKALNDANLNLGLGRFDAVRIFDESNNVPTFTLVNIKGTHLRNFGCITSEYLNKILDDNNE